MFSYIWSTKRKVVEQGCETSSCVKGEVPLFWREHCMECAMPLCYKECSLYKRRMDGRCIRFDYGIVPVELHVGMHRIDGAEISFRRWAKLQCDYNGLSIDCELKSILTRKVFRWVERLTRCLCDALHHYRLCQISASLMERANSFLARRMEGEKADCFLALVKNCQNAQIKMIIETVGEKGTVAKWSFELRPGWNEKFIGQLDGLNGGKFIRVYLDGDQTARLIFQQFGFFKLKSVVGVSRPAKKVKCVAWDLDNTLWNGVIGDVGADGITMKDEALALIKEFDRRGILQTIASKNTFDIAWSKLAEEGISEYFLYPAINWGRKSESIKAIAQSLNINVDSFCLIDDSRFERSEVCAALPQVRVYDAAEIGSILTREEFDMPITEESARRRLSYKEEEHRMEIKASWSGDYSSFLKSCGLVMTVFRPENEEDLKRCVELLNRSNQYNISGKRYSSDELKSFLSQAGVSHYAFRVKDSYGDYGIVGYATFVSTANECRLLDFVMSCRVAQKKIERAFVGWIVNQLPRKDMLHVCIKKTDRNKPLQDEFLGMPFEMLEGNELELKFKKDGVIDDDVVRVEVRP